MHAQAAQLPSYHVGGMTNALQGAHPFAVYMAAVAAAGGGGEGLLLKELPAAGPCSPPPNPQYQRIALTFGPLSNTMRGLRLMKKQQERSPVLQAFELL